MGGCFAENRHMVFFWKLPGKRACGVLLEQMLERTHDVWKGYKYIPMDSVQCEMVLVHLVVVWSAFVMTSERKMHQKSSGGVLTAACCFLGLGQNGRASQSLLD